MKKESKFYKSMKGDKWVALFSLTEEDDYYHLKCIETTNEDLFEVDSYYYVGKEKLTKPMNGYVLTPCPQEEEVLLNIKYGNQE